MRHGHTSGAVSEFLPCNKVTRISACEFMSALDGCALAWDGDQIGCSRPGTWRLHSRPCHHQSLYPSAIVPNPGVSELSRGQLALGRLHPQSNCGQTIAQIIRPYSDLELLARLAGEHRVVLAGDDRHFICLFAHSGLSRSVSHFYRIQGTYKMRKIKLVALLMLVTMAAAAAAAQPRPQLRRLRKPTAPSGLRPPGPLSTLIMATFTLGPAARAARYNLTKCTPALGRGRAHWALGAGRAPAFNLTGLRPGTSYTCWVAGVNAAGEGPRAVVRFATLPRTFSGALFRRLVPASPAATPVPAAPWAAETPVGAGPGAGDPGRGTGGREEGCPCWRPPTLPAPPPPPPLPPAAL